MKYYLAPHEWLFLGAVVTLFLVFAWSIVS